MQIKSQDSLCGPGLESRQLRLSDGNRSYLNNFIALSSVDNTPQIKGMPTKPQAIMSCSVLVPFSCVLCMMFSPYALALSGAVASALLATLPGLSPTIQYLDATALTRRLQMKPTTNKPAMMYMVLL